MTSGAERSATFRDLVARLDAADVLVYVRFSRCAGTVPACTLWASEDPRLRRLLVKLDRFGHSPDELTALLAHELQHALEVAEAGDIRDAATFRRSFAAHGRKGTDGFETERSKEVARKVAMELRR